MNVCWLVLGLPPFVFFLSFYIVFLKKDLLGYFCVCVIRVMNFLGVVCDWDPMQTDYLSSQNKYHKLKKKARPCE